MRGIAIGAFFFSVLVTGCGQPSRSVSSLQYRISGPSSAGLTWKVANETIKICYSDPNNSATHKSDVVYAVETWIDALRDVAEVPLATAYELVGLGQVCDMEVRIGNYSPAYTQMGAKPKLFINHTGWYGSKTVTLHEMGHGFGLLDTYEGRGGSCQPGQPNSVMCRASYEDLQPDDVSGIRAIYSRVIGSKGFIRADENEGRIVY